MSLLAEIYERLLARGYATELFAELGPTKPCGINELLVIGECPFCGKRGKFEFSLIKPVWISWTLGEGGSWVDYLMRRRHLDFHGALAVLAEAAGVELKNYDPKEAEQRDRIAALLEAAQRLFASELWQPAGKPVLDYLVARGYSEAEIKAMELGAFMSQERLHHHLNDLKFTRPEIAAAGVFTGGFGTTHQLTLLWTDGAGRPLGLVCRSLLSAEQLKAQGLEKYKYSSGMKRSAGLVGLPQARGKRAALLVEGPLDAMLLNHHGLPAVAAGGTSLSELQYETLERALIKELLVAFDSDKAGCDGAERICRRLLAQGELRPFVVRLPDGFKDPDELLRAKGVAAMQECLDGALGGARWLGGFIPTKHSLKNDRERERCLAELNELAATLSAQDKTDLYNAFKQATGLKPPRAAGGRVSDQKSTGGKGAGRAKGKVGVNPRRYQTGLILRLNQSGNAERFVHSYGDRVLHCALLGGWHCWDGKRWLLDSSGEALSFAIELARRMSAESLNLDQPVTVLVPDGSGGERERTVSAEDARALSCYWAERTLDAPAKMLEPASADRRIAVLPEQLDANPRLLNCNNATLNLEPAVLLAADDLQRAPQPHEQLSRITKLAPVDWEAGADCPRWKQFLGEIFAADEPLIEFVRRLIGYCLFGGNPEQVIAFLWGTGANGKSTLLETVAALLGDYAATTTSEIVLAREGGSNNQVFALAQLRGARLLTIAETDEGQRLAEGLVKGMTGGERISARFSHGNFFSYVPEFLPVVATNHMPELRNVDEAIRRRVLLVPFKVTIPREDRDPRLKEVLRAELSGILRWAVDGLIDYEERLAEGKSGLNPPDSVRAATENYFAEQDPVAPFVEERCRLSDPQLGLGGAGPRAKKGALYQAYRDWCDSQGRYSVRIAKFGALLKRLLMAHYNAPAEAVETHSGSDRWWIGVGLAEAPEQNGGLY